MILSPQFMLASELIETVVQLSDCYDKKLIDKAPAKKTDSCPDDER